MNNTVTLCLKNLITLFRINYTKYTLKLFSYINKKMSAKYDQKHFFFFFLVLFLYTYIIYLDLFISSSIFFFFKICFLEYLLFEVWFLRVTFHITALSITTPSFVWDAKRKILSPGKPQETENLCNNWFYIIVSSSRDKVINNTFTFPFPVPTNRMRVSTVKTQMTEQLFE